MFKTLITHRGIDVPFGSNHEECLREGSWEAFTEQIDAGFGLEFDIQLTRDGGFAISHDSNLRRLTNGKNIVDVRELSSQEFCDIKVPGGRLCILDELLEYMVEHATAISALHLKAPCQTADILNALSIHLKSFEGKLDDRLMIFDVNVESARFLKAELKKIQLAASVSHPFDIARYGATTGGTLMDESSVLRNRDLFSWVWLDEWDRVGINGSVKTLVNGESVKQFHKAGFKIAAVSPELHATSPCLLGGEAHEDGLSIGSLSRRWENWESIGVDAICTDHATALSTLIIN